MPYLDTYEFGYGDVSPYSTAEGTFPHTPEVDETLPHTLPTVYSPTPSLPTILSPSSAASHGGKGYLEVYRVPMEHIDAPCSSSPTVPSMSFASSPTADSIPFFSPVPYPLITSPADGQSAQLPTAQQYPSAQAIMSRPSFRLHRKPSKPMSRVPSIRRRLSAHSNAASHGSCRTLIQTAHVNSFTLLPLLLAHCTLHLLCYHFSSSAVNCTANLPSILLRLGFAC